MEDRGSRAKRLRMSVKVHKAPKFGPNLNKITAQHHCHRDGMF